MKNYDYIILDWDGNLAKTLAIWLKAYKTIFRSRGHSLKDEEIAGALGQMPAFAKGLGIEDPEKAIEEGDIIARKTLPNVALYPDALEVLEYLRFKNKHLALLTTSIREHVASTLEKYDLQKYFEVILAGDDQTHHKPHPEGIEKALEKMNGKKDRAVIIGDSDKDIGAANNAGIDSILFYPHDHKKYYNLEKLKSLKLTFVVEDFKEIKMIIK